MQIFSKGSKMEPLVLIPGMMCDHSMWAEQIDYFQDRFSIYIPDISKHQSIEAIASAILDDLPDEDFNLAGLSMGGIISMEIMRVAEDRIKKVALFDTNHRAELKQRQIMRQAEIDKAKAGGLRDIMVSMMKPAYLIPGKYYRPELSDEILQAALRQGVDTFVNQSLALRERRNYTEVLEKVELPVLIAYGEKDTLCPPSRHHEMFALLANKDTAQLHEIEDSGHLVTMEQPDKTNEIMSKWFCQTA